MKMTLLGVIVGLFAVVHSIPVSTVTQSSSKLDEAINQAVSEGFIPPSFYSLVTESPKTNTTEVSQQPVSNSKESDMTKSSTGGETDVTPVVFMTDSAAQAHTTYSTESYTFEGSAAGGTDVMPTASTTLSATNAWISGSSENYMFEGSAAGRTDVMPAASTSATNAWTSSLTESYTHEGSTTGGAEDVTTSHATMTFPPPESTTTVFLVRISEPNEVASSTTSHPTVTSQTTESVVVTVDVSSSESGSRDAPKLETSTGSTPTTTLPETTHFLQKQVTGRGSEPQPPRQVYRENDSQKQEDDPDEHHKGHITPGWIIIVAFVVAVAAIVMLCVAIATRKKWNSPNPACKAPVQTNSLNQQREQEMETFLHKEEPKENGKASEYTVIPLEELPENHSSL